MRKALLIIFIFFSGSGYAQYYDVSIFGNDVPLLNDPESYGADWYPYIPGGGSYYWSADIGTVLTSDESSCTVKWTSLGNGVLFYEYETWDNYSSANFFVDVYGVPPSAPVAYSATDHSTTSFKASWSQVTGATSYRLDVSTNSNFSSFVSGYNNISVSTMNRTVTGLSGGTTYYYRVRAVNGSTLTKTGTDAWDGGAFSENEIPIGGDGWIEFRAENTPTYRMIGLSDQDNDANYTSIDYAVYFYNSNEIHIWENSVYRGYFGSYSASDLFQVERKNGTIYYKKNGALFYTSPTSSSSALYADASLNTVGATILDVTIGRGIHGLKIVENQYNELGQLIEKNLPGPVKVYSQSVDYRYNIRGWLTSINNAQLNADPLTNEESDDLFGMELLYNQVDATLANNDQFNGNISAVKWKTPIEGATALEDRKSYKFSYDPMNRLSQASFGAYKPSANWTSEANAFNETLTYDLNGNIQSLQRNKAKSDTSAFSIVSATMDDLNYTYLSGNQLSQVEDGTSDDGGFKDGASNSSEYLYDDNGNMIKDLNKGIDSITYNHLNLPSLITFSNGNTIQYTYDANGVKLKQTVVENTSSKVTDYVGNIVYENDTLRFFSIPEGRVVNNNGEFEYQFMLKDHLGNTRVLYGNPFEGDNLIANADCNNTTGFPSAISATVTAETINGETYIKCVGTLPTNTGVYPITGGYFSVKTGEKYTLKVKGYSESNNAHLYIIGNTGNLIWPGNALPVGSQNEGWVSSDVTIPTGVTQIWVGVLLWNPAVGNTFYLNEVALFKHKDDDYPAGFEASEQENEYYRFSNYDPTKINNSGAYSRTGSSAYLLSGSTQVSNQVIGPAKSIRVYPGDAVHIEVYGRYLTTTGSGTNVGSVIAGALQSAFGLSAGGVTDVAYQSIGDLFGDGVVIGTAGYPYEDAAPPKAFLNYILFDDNYVPYDFGYDQIGTDGAMPGTGSDKMKLVAKIRKPGYIYIYLSNENEVTQEVYFDDLAIKHVKGVAIQQSDYYPFGLTFNSYQRENSVDQKFKFQGQEHIDDLNLGWDSFKWRNHMPDIGRFFNIDPLSEKFYYNSPYAFSENKVVAHVELEGLESYSINGLTNGEFSKYENMAKPLLNDPKPEAPPTGGDKVLNGVGNVLFGTVGAIGSGLYVIGTEGAGAALGGGTAFSLSLGEVAIGFAQIVDGVSEMNGGNSDQTGILQNSSSLPGLVGNATGFENAPMIDAVGQFVPGMLTGGNLNALKEGWSVIKSSENAAQATQNVLSTVDAGLDTKGVIDAALEQKKKEETPKPNQ